MATEADRRAKYQHNLRFLETINDAAFADWAATAAFYAALQLVEALLDRKSIRDHSSHAARNRILQETRSFQNIWRNYKPLYEASVAARYIDLGGISYAQFEQWIPLDAVRRELVNRHLREVRRSVGTQLGWPPDETAPGS